MSMLHFAPKSLNKLAKTEFNVKFTAFQNERLELMVLNLGRPLNPKH